MREAGTGGLKLILASLLLLIVFGAYSEVVKYSIFFEDWKIFDYSQTRVYILDHSDSDLQKKLANHRHPNLEEHISKHPHQPSVSYSFKMDDKFSLLYREGNLITKEGICPGGSNLERLKAFRTAISERSNEQDGRLKLKVQGFASVAPVTVDATQSNLLNRDIANQRAEAVIYYLTMADITQDSLKKCRDALNDSLIWDSVKSDSIWQGKNFVAIYNPWETYGDMAKAKPAEDDSSGGSRQRDLEFLNRTVQIIVKGGDF